MIIVKTQVFDSFSLGANDIAKFINVNNIKREDILSLVGLPDGPLGGYAIFYYGDSETKEITPGFFGW